MGLIELWFRLSEVAPIVEHAMSASEHTKYPDPNDDSPAVPSLIWVKDDGTYLLSNGRPRLLADPTQPEGMAQVAYAQTGVPVPARRSAIPRSAVTTSPNTSTSPRTSATETGSAI
ncbi:hypothetical protein [Nocardia brasiliensis]|uniref:hypothetical protein n=1 Tax=Nocardia brasiliensis TaxID=37326 RepID=UPI00366A7C5F